LKSNGRLLYAYALTAVLWFCPPAFSQPSGTGSSVVSGTVVDPTGAPIAGASLTIRSASGSDRSVNSGPDGAFTFSELSPGLYRLSASSPRFDPGETKVTVGTGPIVPVRISLSLSTVSAQVVVTASRSEEDAEKQPVSTSVVTLPDIQARNVQLLDESLDSVPGLYVQRTRGAADSEASVYLRGFNGPNRTLVLLNGQSINDAFFGNVSWDSLPIDEVQSIEVVRGPFSSLYGGEAMGGVVNILTRPISHREFDLFGEYGTYNTKRYSGRYSDRLFNKLGFSVGYQRLQFGGYPTNPVVAYPGEGTGPTVTGAIPTLDPYGNQAFVVGNSGTNWASQHSVFVKGDYSFSPSTILRLEYMLQSYANGNDMYQSALRTSTGAVADNGTFLVNYNGVPQAVFVAPSSFIQVPLSQHSHFVTGSLLHKFSSDKILQVDAGYYKTPNYNYRTPDFFSNASGGTGTYTEDIMRNFHGNIQYRQTIGRQSITAGTEARQDAASNPIFDLSNWTLPGTRGQQTYLASGKDFTVAAYVQDEINLTEHLHLVAGGRYEYWRTYDGLINGYSASAPLTNYPKRSTNSVTGKIGATYGLARGWTIRASAGTAFRNPTVYELYATFDFFGTIYAGNPRLNPEHDRSWELGVHKRVGTRADFDADYYQNNISQLIYSQTDYQIDPTGNYFLQTNAGQGRTRGVEAALRVRLLSWLSLRASYAFTNARITNNPAEPDSVGKRVPNIPTEMISGQLLAQRGKWSGSLIGRYAGATFITDNNIDTTKGVPGAYDPFFLLNANIGYQVNPHLQIIATADNLLDRQYYQYYLAPGRTVYGGFRFKW
jgi:iron complex outermembrane receptor protein